MSRLSHPSLISFGFVRGEGHSYEVVGLESKLADPGCTYSVKAGITWSERSQWMPLILVKPCFDSMQMCDCGLHEESYSQCIVSMFLAQSTNWGHYPDWIGIFEVLVFEERGKPEYPEKNLRLRRRTNNKVNRVQELNPGHIGGRRVLSPLCHPCSPEVGSPSWPQ